MDEIISKLMSHKKGLIIALIGAGILLIALSVLFSEKQVKAEAEFDDLAYTRQLEGRIESIVSSISGAGKCDVMISLATTSESVYVKENKKMYDSGADTNKSETEDSVLTMTDGDGSQYALVTKQIMPEVGGVTVVCEGGNNPAVKASVIYAVSTVLGIGSNKVCVIH